MLGLRRKLIAAIPCIAALAFMCIAGCAQDTRPASKRNTLKVGVVYAGALGDFSYNDLARDGLTRIENELQLPTKGIETDADAPEGEKVQLVETFAKAGYNPIIGMTFAYSKAVDEVASRYPDTRFAVVDGDPPTQPNVMCLKFSVAQGSFLAGAAAALKSRTGAIGFVGGMETPAIQQFYAGYAAGAKYVNPRIKVLSKYISQPPDDSGFRDPVKGRIAAEGQLDSGVDVIFHAAGAAGVGVIDAAAAAGKKAIGVDADQYRQPGLTAVRDHIITSMLKRVDVAVLDFVAAVKADRFEGGTKIYDLSNKGVGYATSGGGVDDIQEQLRAIEGKIIEGAVKVPEA
ncbi:BMP family lipoprotein [Sphaerisporangium sp. NPDC004334]